MSATNLSERVALARALMSACLLRGEFRLRSGRNASEYFDKYRFESDPNLLRATAAALANLIPNGTDALAGLELGGVPLATALSLETGLPTLFVRKKAKEYGTRGTVEGGDVAGKKIVVIEDVVTSGGQVLESIQKLRNSGAEILCVLCVVDREAGGAESLTAAGLELRPLFRFTELRESILVSHDGLAGESRPPTWDAADYARNSQGQYGWALDNLGKLKLTGYETVLDVGCGDGKITVEIARRVPHGHVVGIDQSADMVALAAQNFELPNVRFRVLDAQALDFNEEFDAIFSNSAIHWMPAPAAAIRGITRALKPGGRMFLSIGGRGTAALPRKAIEELTVEPRWSPYLAEAASPHYFFGPDEYLPWLAEAGLHADRVELVPKPMRLPSVQALEGWLRTTWMTYWQRLPVEERPDFIRELTERVRGGCETADEGALLMPMINLEVEAHKKVT